MYLRAIGVLASIRHAQNSWPSVTKFEVLVFKLFPKNRFSTSAIIIGKVPLGW
jgi:hypothetical protein